MSHGVFTPAINQQIDQLFSSILVEQKKINKISPPDHDKAVASKKIMDEYVKNRGRPFTYSNLSSGRGHGPFIEHFDGAVKYDLIGGIGINLLGHSHPLYIRSSLESAAIDTMMCGNLQPYAECHDLTKAMVESVKSSRLRHFWFSLSGSFAGDIALKIIWQKMAPKYGIIAFDNAFAGRSIATQEITANPGYREGMPTYLDVSYAPHFDQANPTHSLQKTLKALDEIWEKKGPTLSCLTMELIQGEAGFVFGPRDYYVGIFEWAKKKGLYIWVDEVQSFGRTHQLFAFQTFGLEQYVDVVTVAKVLQEGGVLYTEELNPKAGLIAGTFCGSMAQIIAGTKTVKFLSEGGFYGADGRMAEIEKKFLKKLNSLKDGSCKGKIKYAGGIGTMISFEVGKSDKDDTNKFLNKLFENGIVAFSAGRSPVRVRFLIPLTITDEHIDEVFQIVEKTVNELF